MKRTGLMFVVTILCFIPILLLGQGTRKIPAREDHAVKIVSASGDSLVPNEVDVSTPKTQKIKVYARGGSSASISELTLVNQAQKRNNKQSKGEAPADYVPYDKAPEVVHQVDPRYPQLAQKAGLEGTVWVKVWVDEEGKIAQATVQKSDAEIFNQAAIDAAMQWMFKPAISKGKPLATWVSIPFRFKIQGYPTEARVQESLGKTILGDRSGMGWQEMLLIMSVVGFFLLLRIILSLVAVIDIVKSQFQDANDKIVWIIVALLFPIIGPIVYFIMAKKQKVSAA